MSTESVIPKRVPNLSVPVHVLAELITPLSPLPFCPRTLGGSVMCIPATKALAAEGSMQDGLAMELRAGSKAGFYSTADSSKNRAEMQRHHKLPLSD